MKAVVLAGGLEVSRCPLALVRPRPLFPLLTDVLLGKLLRELYAVDVDEAIVCANGRTTILREHFLKRPSEHVALEFYDDELPRGAAGCVKDVEGFLGRDTFLVVEAGLFLEGALGRLVEEHRASGSAMTVGAVPTSDWEGGDGKGSEGEPLSPLGVYVAEPDILEQVPAAGYYDIKEQLIPKLRTKGMRVAASRYRGRHRRVFGARSYAAFVHDLLSGVFGAAEFDGLQDVGGQVWKGRGAEIAPTATLIGPVVVGPNAVVGEDAVVAGPSLIGEGAVVEEKAFVSSSILWPNCRVGAGARVEHSIVTDSYRVRELAELSRSVAVDRDFRLGDVHGLRLSGYAVLAQEPGIALAQRQAAFLTALSRLRGSVLGLRNGTVGGRDTEVPSNRQYSPK